MCRSFAVLHSRDRARQGRRVQARWPVHRSGRTDDRARADRGFEERSSLTASRRMRDGSPRSLVKRVQTRLPRAVVLMLVLAAWPSQTFAQRSIFATTLSPEQARAFFIDKTRVTFMPEHGTQVTYMGRDGAVFLWYPGNRVLVPGRWTIEACPNQPGAARLCFQYGANTY